MSSFGSEDSSSLHSYDDVDTGIRAHHHTLGIGPVQAYPGNKGAALDARATALETRTTGLEGRATALEAISAGARLTALETKAISTCNPSANFTQGTSGVPVDITGMTTTINVRGVSDVYMVTAVFDIQITVNGLAMILGRTVVDGVSRGDAIWAPQVLNGRSQVSAVYLVTGLAAGNRIFKGQSWNAAGVGGGTIFSGSQIQVVRLN
jgi:hypothetical protein